MTIRWGLVALPLAVVLCANAEMPSTGLTIAGVAFPPSDIAEATAGDDGYGSATVRIRFTPKGAERFLALQQGMVGKPLPIAIDGEEVSAPILTEIIGGGDVQISGNMTPEAAAALAARLAPPAPAPTD